MSPDYQNIPTNYQVKLHFKLHEFSLLQTINFNIFKIEKKKKLENVIKSRMKFQG